MDLIKYVVLQSHVSGPTNLWNTDVWKSFSTHTAGPIYDPISYSDLIGPAIVFYKNMLARRQRVLVVSAMEESLRISGPFSHIFLTSAWIGGALTNYRKVENKLRHSGVFLDVLKYLESTLYNKYMRLPQVNPTIVIMDPEFMEHSMLQLHNINIKSKNIKKVTLLNIVGHIHNKYSTTVELYTFRDNDFPKLSRTIYYLFWHIRMDFYTSFIHLFLYHLLTLYIHKISSFVVTTKRDLDYEQEYGEPLAFELYQQKPILTYIQQQEHEFLFGAEAPNYLTALRFFVALFRNFYRKRGLEIVRIKRRRFPSINVALDLSLANMYILNESRYIYLPLISFHKSTDPARGPVYTIPAHIGTRRQITAYGYFFLGFVLKQQTMDLKQLYLWARLQDLAKN